MPPAQSCLLLLILHSHHSSHGAWVRHACSQGGRSRYPNMGCADWGNGLRHHRVQRDAPCSNSPGSLQSLLKALGTREVIWGLSAWVALLMTCPIAGTVNCTARESLITGSLGQILDAFPTTVWWVGEV